MSFLLPPSFFIIALLYASVGLGGGSSYSALLILSGVDYDLIPTTTLSLNLVVTTFGALTFFRSGALRWQSVWPYMVTSVPMAYLGGFLVLPKNIFLWILLGALVAVAVRIYFWPGRLAAVAISPGYKLPLMLGIGALLGFLAGVVGIGGGIFLVPAILLLGLGNESQAAAAGSMFVWINSLAGLLSRVQRGAVDINLLLPLAVAVAVGGLLGAYLSAYRWQPRTMQRVLGLVILAAIASIGRQLV